MNAITSILGAIVGMACVNLWGWPGLLIAVPICVALGFAGAKFS